MDQKAVPPRIRVIQTSIVLVLLISLYLTGFYDYLLFHSLVEIFSIVIACGLFMIAWNARDLIDSPALVHLGIAYLFIAFLDLMHTLSYTGMNIFTDYDYYANQLWIATRYLESVTLLYFSLRMNSPNRNFSRQFILYFLITTAIILSIFVLHIFPVCFVEGVGLTPFKIVSEYIISLILVVSLIIFFRKRDLLAPQLFKLLFWSIVATIGSEIAFTFYIDNYGLSNMIGHYLKLLSFYLLYISLVREGIRNPVMTFYSRLEKTAADLQIANQTKNRFFSIIGHDLKNSFNSTIGITDLILAKSNQIDMSGKEGLDLIRMINSSAKSAYELLENLLAWARNESGALTVHPEIIDLTEVFQKVRQHHFLTAEEKEIKIVLDLPDENCFVEGDTNMIYTALRNLLGNALKFTHRGGEVRLRAAAERARVRIEVCDNGIGIDPEQLQKILSATEFRSTRGTEAENGTGLGLKVTNEFIERNGGSLKVTNNCADGSCFYFSLPSGAGPAAEQH